MNATGPPHSDTYGLFAGTASQKINEIMDSILAMSRTELKQQMLASSKLVSELLQNEAIAVVCDDTVRLLTYELVFLLIEQQTPIQNLLPHYLGAVRGLSDNQRYKNQDWRLMGEESAKPPTKRRISQTQRSPQRIIQCHLARPKLDLAAESELRLCVGDDQPQGQMRSQEIEALMEMLSEKQTRIRELEDRILDQKQRQDFVEGLQVGNGDLLREIEQLQLQLVEHGQDAAQKILELKRENQQLQDRVSAMETSRKANAGIHPYPGTLYSEKQSPSTEKSINTRFTRESYSQSIGTDKGIMPNTPELLLEEVAASSSQNIEHLGHFLYIQAVSIDNLITQLQIL